VTAVVALQPSPRWTGEYAPDLDEVRARGPTRPSSDKVDEGGDEGGDPNQPIFLVCHRNTDMPGLMEVNSSRMPLVLLGVKLEDCGSGIHPSATALESSSSAIAPRDQDGTVVVLMDSTGGNALPLSPARIH
jgi:hypothetical protein